MSELDQFTQPNQKWLPTMPSLKPNFYQNPGSSQPNQSRPNFSPNQANQCTPAKIDQETKRIRCKPELDDEETVRRRDILVSVAVLGELEQYVGEHVEPAKIRTMKREKLDLLFSAYETKLGKEMTENGMETIVGSAVKVINWFVPLDDSEALKADLMENKPLRRSLGRHCAGMAERYGDFVAFSKVIYDVVKHIKFSPQTETPSPTDAGVDTTH